MWSFGERNGWFEVWHIRIGGMVACSWNGNGFNMENPSGDRWVKQCRCYGCGVGGMTVPRYAWLHRLCIFGVHVLPYM